MGVQTQWECNQNPPEEGITKILKALEVLDRDKGPRPANLFIYLIALLRGYGLYPIVEVDLMFKTIMWVFLIHVV